MFANILRAFRDRRDQSSATTRIEIKGMTCKRCVQTIKKALFAKHGVKRVFIDLGTGLASVTYDPDQTDLATLEQIIRKKGYFPAVIAE